MALYNVWHTESGRNTRQYDARSREDAARLWFSEEGGDSVKVTVELIKTGALTNHRVVRKVKYKITEI